MCTLDINRICAVIITYNPDNRLLDLIEKIKTQVDKIIIVDNNSINEHLLTVKGLEKSEEIVFIYNDENVGIGKALNQGIRVAINMGYDWAITFDQDSVPFDDIIHTIHEVFSEYEHKKRIGAIGVNYIYRNSVNNYSIDDSVSYFIKDSLITSGCLLSLNCFLLIRGFREDLFIDHVDEEYSLRLKNQGKVSLITNKPGMIHECGTPITRNLLGITFASTNHNELRRYYMARNQVILGREYFFKYPCFVIKSCLLFFYEVIEMIILDSSKIGKIKATNKGIWHGLFYLRKNRRYYE